MSAWAFLVGNFARTPEELRVFSDALQEVKTEERRRSAARQRAFFGDITAQGNDGNWYSISGWLTRPLNDKDGDPVLPDRLTTAMKDRIITEVAGDSGFWSQDAANAYISLGLRLLDAGHGDDEIIDWLSNIYSATAGEYGG